MKKALILIMIACSVILSACSKSVVQSSSSSSSSSSSFLPITDAELALMSPEQVINKYFECLQTGNYVSLKRLFTQKGLENDRHELTKPQDIKNINIKINNTIENTDPDKAHYIVDFIVKDSDYFLSPQYYTGHYYCLVLMVKENGIWKIDGADPVP